MALWKYTAGLAVSGVFLAASPATGREGDSPPEVLPAPPATAPETGDVSEPKDYGPIEAGQEAFERADTRRREAMDRQLGLNETLRAYADPGNYTVPSADELYAYLPPRPPLPPPFWGPRRASRYAVQSSARYSTYYPYAAFPPYGPVFGPWPYVPGRIYGYPYLPRIPQPVGQVQIEIGPNKILSRPVYADEPDARQPTPAPPREPAEGPEIVPAPALPELIPPEEPEAPQVLEPPSGPQEF